jgi:aryl-alcohol dehydrogenase-like predicted oxidoreductase
MRFNLLGQTGLYVSEMCLGTQLFPEYRAIPAVKDL